VTKSVEPIYVAEYSAVIPSKYTTSCSPMPLLQTEQLGRCYTYVSPLTGDVFKGGDSGSPDMIPMPDGLVMVSGRTTTGARPQMQLDMDYLTELLGLDTNSYQLNWYDFDSYEELNP